MLKLSGSFALLSVLATVARASTVWSGNFNSYPNVSTFDNWSWSDEVGEYQWYIHGSEPTAYYLALDPSYKNPADTAETQGIRMRIDDTSLWSGQTMARTELIPQTSQNLGVGTMFYHFSIMISETNYPNFTLEHQICFFESHFTELKIGVAPYPSQLQWMANSNEQWTTVWTPGTWYNFAYEINFSAQTAGLWTSTGGNPLTQVVSNVAVSASTNSEDWHLGVLRVVGDAGTEDFYFSGVYVESGSITTSIGTGSGSTSSTSTSTVSSSTSTVVSSTSSSSSSSASASSTGTTSSGAAEYAQCGGIGWTGATSCVSPYVCTALNAYYSQCLT